MMKESQSQPIDIGSYICKYLEILRLREGLSPHTTRAYGSDLLQVFQIKEAGKLSISENNKSVSYRIHWTSDTPPPAKPLQDWKVVIQEQTQPWVKLSAKTKKRKWSSLRSFLDWLSKEENLHIEFNPPPSQKVPHKLPRFLSVDECLLLAKYLLSQKERSPALNQQTLLFFLMYGAGMRLSEACELRWENIDLQQRKFLFQGKGKKERTLIVPPIVCQVLKNHGNQETASIWGSAPLPTRTAYERIRSLGKKAGLLKPLNPHALRHSYASQLLSGGSDLRVLQQLLGHESLSATELYTHLDIDHLARSMEDYHPLGSSSDGEKNNIP